ncbi:putative transposase [Mobilicoccus pelagius NBRC 104925]|uniref:Putative transposase n=1 Tax=Mobilicoccus pelagius NBRC 104925 TaxID=1089455 RepID=H5UPR3_9MICO|nr:putative transposase [Mobilicoccus pelagius NBRC 104925]
MARKTYSEEFRRQAVELYETTPGATVRGIADDLGIVRGTLTQWLREHGTGKKVAADGTAVDSPVHHAGARAGAAPPADETPEQELARLRGSDHDVVITIFPDQGALLPSRRAHTLTPDGGSGFKQHLHR